MTMNLIMREMGAKAESGSFWWDKKGAGAAVTVKETGGNGGDVRRALAERHFTKSFSVPQAVLG